MANRKLTDASVKSLSLPDAGQVDYFDSLLPAFGIRVSYGGAKTWFVSTRIGGAGKLVRVSLGRYPALSLSDARDKARGVLEMAGRGVDPRQAAIDERQENARKAVQTFAAVSADFIRLYAEKNLRAATTREYKRTFKVECEKWAERPIGSITRRDVLDVLDGLEKRGKDVLAARTLAYVRKFFGWCVDRDLIDTNPASDIRRGSASKPRERVLTTDEIKFAWDAFKGLGYPFGMLFQLLLLTGQRKSEVAGMRWDELRDWDTAPLWALAGDRTKNGKPHLVPISPEAKAIIDACPRTGALVFTTTTRVGQVVQGVHEAVPVSGFSKAKAAVDLAIEKANDGTPLPHWTLHDLRRTFVTHASERLAVPPHVIEAIINHISGTKGGVAGVYNRAQYLQERREVLEAWAVTLCGAAAVVGNTAA